MVGTIPIPYPADAPLVTELTAEYGAPVPPIARIRIFSPAEWEEFILEWATSLKSHYSKVELCAGRGDMGRDVVAYHKDNPDHWDNYQCKHYGDSLSPSQVWIEFGKLIYYSKMGEYNWPSEYFFVAPLGVGVSLSKLLNNENELRSKLKANWEKHCKDHITRECSVNLDISLTKYIDALDFSIFRAKQPLEIIEEHAKTPWHIHRFGGRLPERPPITNPPSSPLQTEQNYIKKLLDAYAEHTGRDVKSHEEIPGSNLKDHFSRSRNQFYSAESLREFSRDTLPPGAFGKLQDEFYDGIIDEVCSDHNDGYERVQAVVKHAQLLQISGHALRGRLKPMDRAGICHQLANDKDNVGWVR